MELKDIKHILSNCELNDKEIRLNKCTVLTNQKKFVESHLKALGSNPGNKRYLPYYKRLKKFVELIVD